MRLSGFKPAPTPAIPPADVTRFHGFKPRHIKRQLGQLYAELHHVRDELCKGFNIDEQSYGNILRMYLMRDAALPPYNSMPLPDYVNHFHHSGMSTLLTMIEPMIVFMAAYHEPMDLLSVQMRRWGAFEDPFSFDEEQRTVCDKMWKRASKLLGKDVSPADMPRRFVSHYIENADEIEGKVKLTSADIAEINRYEDLARRHGLEDVDYFPATVQLLRRTVREQALDSTDIVRAASTITLSHCDKPPAVLATDEGVRAVRAALSAYRPRFRPASDAYGKPFTLN